MNEPFRLTYAVTHLAFDEPNLAYVAVDSLVALAR